MIERYIRKIVRSVLAESSSDIDTGNRDTRRIEVSNFVKTAIGSKIGDFVLIDHGRPEMDIVWTGSNSIQAVDLYRDALQFGLYFVHDKKEDLWYEVQLKRNLSEAAMSFHANRRLERRMSLDKIATAEELHIIRENLRKVKETQFPADMVFGVLLGNLEVDENSPFFIKIDKKNYYMVTDENGKDSIGNQVWCIVKGNVIATIMLRKKDKVTFDSEGAKRMKVDAIIKNIDDTQNSKTL